MKANLRGAGATESKALKTSLLVLLLLTSLGGPALAQPQGHPLDPLSQHEVSLSVQVLQRAGKLHQGVRFPVLTLQEPPKSEVLAFDGQSACSRKALVVLLDPSQKKVFEAIVDLRSTHLESFRELPGKQPGLLMEEFEKPAGFIRQNPAWQAAVRKRGIEDFENVQIDPWGMGILTPEERGSGKRLLRCLSFYRPPGAKNPFARPVEGVIVVFDPQENKVLRVEDSGLSAPVQKDLRGEMDPATVNAQLGSLRPPLKPLVVSQPQGSNIQVQGHQVRWDNWQFRFSMHPREGLVLHDLRYLDRGNWRQVLYRGALSEMVVPYGDPAPNWNWRNAFDLGEYGVGRLANTLRPGFEVPAHALMLDSVFADDLGKPYLLPASVALYERDAGILWKHYDLETQSDQTRPARDLHLTYVATIGNYDYALSWVLSQDGSLGVSAQLTGIVLAKGVASARSQGLEPVGDERFGRLVAPHIVAPNHQHFFNFRLDLDVDGPNNSLFESNNKALPAGPDNPLLNAFSRLVTPLKMEMEAMRDLNMHSQRNWLVVNPNLKNRLGQHPGYQLMHGENSVPYLHPDSPIYRRAGFLKHHLWATRFHPGELYASGDYPNQSEQSSGLPGWCQDNESLENQDLVLWYTCGVTHNPRPEEWPVMPSHRTGFKLVPNGFFSSNPALDVAPNSEVKP